MEPVKHSLFGFSKSVQYCSLFRCLLWHADGRSIERSPQTADLTPCLGQRCCLPSAEEHTPASMLGLHGRLTNAATKLLHDGMQASK